MFLNKKEQTFLFTKEGFNEARKSNIQRLLEKKKIKSLISSSGLLILNSQQALATNTEVAGWKFVGVARQGLFWIGIFVSIYGLYLMVLKKDDTGKKIIVTAILAYIGSWIIPNVFIDIRDTFSH